MNPKADLALLGGVLEQAFLCGGLVLARVGPVVWLAPFLGGRLTPATTRAGVAMILAMILLPQLSGSVDALAGSHPLILVGVVAKECFVGFALGFIASLVFLAAEAAGRLSDLSRGASFAEALVPQLGTRSSPLGDLFFQLAVVIFIILGGHRIFIVALASSYDAIPLEVLPSAEGIGGFVGLAARLTAEIFLIALSLAAPVIAAVLLADATLGMMNRFVPALQAFFLAMPLRALLGLVVLVLALGTLMALLPGLLEAAVAQVARAIELLGR